LVKLAPEQSLLDLIATQVPAEVRRLAAFSLGGLGRADERILHGLLALARDPQMDAGVRYNAARALKALLGGQ